MNSKDYIRLSLELHLFFDRIMKEHSLFLEASLMEKDQEYKKIAKNFQTVLQNILENVIHLANGRISPTLLSSNEFITNNTLEAENQTSRLTGIEIATNLTLKEASLQSGNIDVNEQLLMDIRDINRKTLSVIQNLIDFKQEILSNVISCKLYTTNYPLLITHIMNVAKMYHDLLSRVEKKEPFTEQYMYQQELFWNNIMKEHAEFIRGLLDPSEQELMEKANQFAQEYELIIQNYHKNPIYFSNASFQETKDFRNFKITGEEGILTCKIKSIIIPLLADHVVREANHFIRLLHGIQR